MSALPPSGLRAPAAARAAAAFLCLVFLCLALPARCLPAARAEATHTVVYFYRNYCESCDPEADFAAEFRSLTGLDLGACDFTAWNAARQDGQAALDAALEDLGLETASLPMAVVDGVPYQGASSMNADLARAALAWHDTLDSEVVCLYAPACESCARADAVLDALPAAVTVRRGDEAIESRVIVRRVDISAEPEYAQALFDAYGVPDEARITPIAFFADRFLSGADAIGKRLADEVALGRAAGGVPVAEAGAAPSGGALGLAQSAVSGLVAGLNGCALSMLLLFLSLLLDSGRSAVLPAAAFLASKLACYLLIGFGLLGLFQRFDPVWLRPLARWVMTLLGGALIALNLSDALHARRSDFAGVRNQLPTGLRGRLQRTIRALTARRVLLPAAVALGFIVAGGEFLCAGQLYLMQLLAAVQSGGGRQAAALVAYCAAFLVPSALMTALLLGGGSRARASVLLSRRLAAVKLLTAGAMLLLILAAWML